MYPERSSMPILRGHQVERLCIEKISVMGQFFWLAMMLFALLSTPSQAATPSTVSATSTIVPVHVSKNSSGSRIIFDFPRLTGYLVKTSDKKVEITFNTPYDLDLPGTRTPLVRGFQTLKQQDGTLKLRIDIPENAFVKHSRHMRKVILEITPSAKDTSVIAAAKPSPVKPAIKTPAEKQAPMEKPAPEKVTIAPAPEKPAAPKPKAPATPPAAPSPAVAKNEPAPAAPSIAENMTTISLPTISPTRFAVFTRFGTLWVVMDAESAGAFTPSVAGPDAGLIGNAKPLRFNGGTAYRYTLPPGKFIDVKKENLTWNVIIANARLQPPSDNRLEVQFDEESRKAKLMADLKDAGRVIELQDPAIGDTLYVVTTGLPTERIDRDRHFPDVEVIPAALGMVVKPLKDSVRMAQVENFVIVSSEEGIIASPSALGGPTLVSTTYGATPLEMGEQPRLFDFPNWRRGGVLRLTENRRLLEAKIAAASTPDERTDLLMQLALLYFSNNFGKETLGVLRMIEQENETMVKNPNFVALRGAASALAGHYRDALRDLSFPAIQQHPEVNLWKGFAAAASEEWQMANRSFPSDNRLLISYPENIAVPFTIYMAESALRLGRTDSAKALLNSLNDMSRDYNPQYQAALAYLRGEAARQEGDPEEALRLWRPVANGLDRLYHAKASLALANLELQMKETPLKDAVDRVDSLRFAWRGDGLEVQILHNLGLLKSQNENYLAGLRDLKRAAELNERLLNDSQYIRDDMSRIFTDVFTGPQTATLNPLNALALYNEFNSLLPYGALGTTAKLNFTDYLIRMDLLEKAEDMLEEQISKNLVPPEKVPDVSKRLAAVYLLDSKPRQALEALQIYASSSLTEDQKNARALLKARAQSQLNMTEDAIATLSALVSDEAKRLRADVLWRAQKWAQAASAIESMLPPTTGKLSEDQARLVLNTAVALKLAKDTTGLRIFKSRWNDSMAATTLGSSFGVVTRSSGSSLLSDRDTLMKIAGEVDMFKDFLDTYKAEEKGS